MRPQPSRFLAGSESMSSSEKEQDVRRLGDHQPGSGLEIRWCKGNRVWMHTIEGSVQRFLAAALLLRKPRDIDVGDTGLLEREPDEFAAPLNGRPVVQLVGDLGTHDATSSRAFTRN